MGKPIAQAQFLPRTITLGLLPMDRKAIEQQIDHLIDMLDRIDGDADLEPDHEDYDVCDLGERITYYKTLPEYGIDQSKRPKNYDKVLEEYYLHC